MLNAILRDVLLEKKKIVGVTLTFNTLYYVSSFIVSQAK